MLTLSRLNPLVTLLSVLLLSIILSGCNEEQFAAVKPGVDTSSTMTPDVPEQASSGDEEGSLVTNTVTYTQVAAHQRERVDLLIVMDNSGSMRNEQEALRTYMPNVIQTFVKEDLENFRIAVTSTDPRTTVSQGAGEIGAVYKSEDYQFDPIAFVQQVSDAVMLGINGSGREQAIANGELAVRKNLDNPEFIREGAKLVILSVTDEHESSSGRTPEELKESVKSMKPEGVRYLSIGRMQNGSGPHALASSELKRISDVFYDIARTDWQNITKDIGEAVVTFAKSFQLGADHDKTQASLIQVKKNDVIVQNGYVFNEEQNSIIFEENNVPEEGDVIEIVYMVKN